MELHYHFDNTTLMNINATIWQKVIMSIPASYRTNSDIADKINVNQQFNDIRCTDLYARYTSSTVVRNNGINPIYLLRKNSQPKEIPGNSNRPSVNPSWGRLPRGNIKVYQIDHVNLGEVHMRGGVETPPAIPIEHGFEFNYSDLNECGYIYIEELDIIICTAAKVEDMTILPPDWNTDPGSVKLAAINRYLEKHKNGVEIVANVHNPAQAESLHCVFMGSIIKVICTCSVEIPERLEVRTWDDELGKSIVVQSQDLSILKTADSCAFTEPSGVLVVGISKEVVYNKYNEHCESFEYVDTANLEQYMSNRVNDKLFEQGNSDKETIAELNSKLSRAQIEVEELRKDRDIAVEREQRMNLERQAERDAYNKERIHYTQERAHNHKAEEQAYKSEKAKLSVGETLIKFGVSLLKVAAVVVIGVVAFKAASASSAMAAAVQVAKAMAV